MVNKMSQNIHIGKMLRVGGIRIESLLIINIFAGDVLKPVLKEEEDTICFTKGRTDLWFNQVISLQR